MHDAALLVQVQKAAEVVRGLEQYRAATNPRQAILLPPLTRLLLIPIEDVTDHWTREYGCEVHAA